MDYLNIINAFKQQQQQLLLHQHQLQQQLQDQVSTKNTLSLCQQLDNSNMADSLIWQPWRDLQQAAVQHHLYQQQQQKIQSNTETHLTSKELPTTAWRRERRLRTGEYNHPHHHQAPISANSVRDLSPSLSPPPNAHARHSANSSGSVSYTKTNMRSNAHHISIMMAAAAGVRPLSESTNHPPSPSSPPHYNLAGQIHFGQISRSQNVQQINSIPNDDAPLDMSVGNLKQRNSPPPPYREPLPGSHFASSLARPSVITQAPRKRDVKDSTLVTNRENDNRSSESIDEHFRRSLGNDYFSLFSKRSPASQSTKTPSPQPQPTVAHIRSTSPTLPLSSASTLPTQSILTQSELISPPAYPVNLASNNHLQHCHQVHQNETLAIPVIAAQMKTATGPDSPPLPLVVRPNVLQNHQHNIVLQKSSSLIASSPLASPQSPALTSSVKLCSTIQTPVFNTCGSRTASPLHFQQQSLAVSATLSQFASIDNSPSSSPRHTPPVHNIPVSNPSPNLQAIIRIKTEPGLQNVNSNNPTPPASPTSTTNHNIISNSKSNSASTSSPSSPKTVSWKPPINAINTSADVLASVDDHFAKALGDTWKKLLENKEIPK